MLYQYDSISNPHQLEHIPNKTITRDVSIPSQVTQGNGKQHPSVAQLLPTGSHQSPLFDTEVQLVTPI